MVNTISTRSIWTNPIHFLAFGLGLGLIPFMPGTFGTLLAIPLYIILSNFSPMIYGSTVLVLFLLGIWICDKTASDLNYHDYPGIVWDEVVGYLVTMFLIPFSWVWLIIGFILFRLFDIWKPWPISWANKVPGGFGIMLDDVMAAVFSWIVLQMLLRFWNYIYHITY